MKIKHFVPQSLLFLCLFFSAAHAELLPEIDAHEFKSTPLRKSSSGRVYLFHTDDKKVPKTGNLVLIQNEDKPAAAFRVLQNDPQKGEFVAKRVRRYDVGDLQVNTAYPSIEKVADALATPPPAKPGEEVTASPTATTPAESAAAVATPSMSPSDAELEGTPAEKTPETKAKQAKNQDLEVYDYDDDLDKATSPQNLKKIEPVDDEESANTKTDSEVSETIRYSPMKNMLGVGAGFFRNMANFNTAGDTQNGFSLMYSRVIAHDVLLEPKTTQDDVAIEFGFGYYRLYNSDQQNSLYTIYPFTAEFRYDLNLSESYTLFFYGGLQYNLGTATNTLIGPQQTIGLGMMFNLGPHWYLRIDLGWDRVLGGLSIKW